MPGILIRVVPLAILLFFGLRYLLLSIRPNLFEIDYLKLDERRENLADKMDYLKIKAGLKPKPVPPPAAPMQIIREEGVKVYFEYGDFKAVYNKGAGLSNIFLVISLFPELHAKQRFAEGLMGVIALKEASRLKPKYPGILMPRGFKGHIDDEDVEKYYLIYPPVKAERLKNELKEAHKTLFNSHERIHMQFKGQLLEYEYGTVNGKKIHNPLKAKVLYLQSAQLIHAYNNEKPPTEDSLVMEKPLIQ